ncbi:alpha/beta-hydrolase, partial [Meira miltonrushii]
PVELAYESYEPPKDKDPITDAKAVVLCHGLFGSKQNWRSLGKSIAQRLSVPVYAVDLRNHGTSPHISSMRYDEMAKDLTRFFEDHKIKQAILTGHSMGGKTVQSMALDKDVPNDFIRYLISVDMSPARGPLSKEFAQYVKKMCEIEEKQCSSRQEADKVLEEVEPELGTRQFLLTNLTRAPGSDHWTFRIPIKTIGGILEQQIGDFPYDDEQGLMLKADEALAERLGTQFTPKERPTSRFDGETLFVKGAKSKYINKRNIPICDAFFPKAKHVTLETGHWVQAEKPREFVDEMVNFV